MLAPVRWRWVAILAVLKVGLTAPFLGRYGWHGDELYFIAASRHLDLGFVDFPPVVPLIAATDQAIFPGSLVALRFVAVVAGALVIVLTALIARELGASPRAQAWAALGVLLSPVFIGSNALFHTATFDQLAWAVALLFFARLLRGGDPRLWLVIGAAIGMGLEIKHTMVALPVAIFVGVMASNRRTMLLTRWPWLGGCIALVLFVPNLAWQTTHDWISVQYILSHRGHTDGPFAYWWQQVLVFFNPLFVVPAVAGLIALHRDERLRPLVYASVAVLLIFFVLGGKSYYAAPIYPVFYAGAAMWLDQRLLTTRLRVGAFMTPSIAVAAFLALAVLPVAPTPSGLFLDEVGWPDLAQQTAQVYEGVPPDQRSSTVILAHYYQEAAAIDFYGSALGLPHAVSPHLSYWYWAPQHMDPQTALMINFTLDEGEKLFRECRQMGTASNAAGIHNNDYGAPILVCTKPRQPLWQVWPGLQLLD